jgi:hypothetical protein
MSLFTAPAVIRAVARSALGEELFFVPAKQTDSVPSTVTRARAAAGRAGMGGAAHAEGRMPVDTHRRISKVQCNSISTRTTKGINTTKKDHYHHLLFLYCFKSTNQSINQSINRS